MRIAFDTNILAYFFGLSASVADAEKVDSIQDLVVRLAARATLVAPVQTLGELFVALRRRGVPADEARAILQRSAEKFVVAPTDTGTAMAAADLAVDHKLQFWDSLIVMAATEAGCTMILSEDMQHGFVTRGLTVVNPFAEKPHPKLAALLSDG